MNMARCPLLRVVIGGYHGGLAATDIIFVEHHLLPCLSLSVGTGCKTCRPQVHVDTRTRLHWNPRAAWINGLAKERLWTFRRKLPHHLILWCPYS